MHNVIMKAEHLHQLIWMSRPLMQAAEGCVEAGLDRNQPYSPHARRSGDARQIRRADRPEIGPAGAYRIKRQYVQIMCNETLASGLVEQRANPRHKRSPVLALTNHGRTLIEEIIFKEMKLMEELGENLSNEDVATALKVVLAVADSLKKRAGDRE
ncbi:MAG: MarR family winged helix-turn-helix transcriptional regulator [Paracoccaceae bacterium]